MSFSVDVSQPFKLNNKINQLHEWCLRITSKDLKVLFEEVLEINNSVSVHCKNLLCLAIELYKVFNGISPDVTKDVFPFETFIY